MQITIMKAIALILFLSLILLSCSKDQRTVNRLDGKWNVIAAEIQGYGESNPDLIYEFEYCKQKKQTVVIFLFTILKRMRWLEVFTRSLIKATPSD